MSKAIAFESAIEFYGGPELLAAYRGMASEIKQSANEAVGEAVLRKIAVAIADAVLSVPTLTDTDQKPGSKTPGERWWYYRHPTGTQRQKVASAIQTMPLGSKQDRHFVGRRLAIVGQSGQFYGRLIERGFKVKYYYGEKIKNPKEVPGKWPMSRAFRKLRPEMQLEAIRQFADLIDSLGGKRITPRIP
jgi:hypothetical protein